MEKNKENFYVFVDTDGIFADWDMKERFGFDSLGKYKHDEDYISGSILALHDLVRKLDTKYDVSLVGLSLDTSDRLKTPNQNIFYGGRNFVRPIQYLHCGKITPFNDTIEKFLSNKTDKKNFVIINDEIDVLKFRKQTIVVNINDGLTLSMVDDFIDKYYPELKPKRNITTDTANV